MADRALATIRKVEQVLPIEGADLIAVAIVGGWQVVVGKEEFKPGDLGVYFEIDSFLDGSDPRYAFAEERFINWKGRRGMRLKTIKLRKTLSQGLIMPVYKFPEVAGCEEGDDVTALLKIVKWESQEDEDASSGGEVRNGRSGPDFPSFIRKTDQPRLQNIPKPVLKAELDKDYQVTLKKDGSSGTFFRVKVGSPHYQAAKELYSKRKSWFGRLVDKLLKPFRPKEEDILGLASRNKTLPRVGNSNFHKAFELSGVQNLDLGFSYAIQGEVLAPDIQKNYEQVKDVELHIFDIFNIDKQQYLAPEETYAICEAHGLPHVTELFRGKFRDFIGHQEGSDIQALCLEKAEGRSDNPNVKREGIVFKKLGSESSFKAVSNSYLLKKG